MAKKKRVMSGYTGEERRRLNRYLSFSDVWAVAFGCIVGWGAFVMPGTTFLPLAGPIGTVAAMAISTAVMLVIGRNFSYLMENRPQTGGVYSYTKEAFGRDHAFICSWFLSLSYLTIVFLNATALFVVIRTIFGPLLPLGFYYQIAGENVYLGEIILSAATLVLTGLLFILGKPLMQYLQTILAFVLIAGVLVLTFVGLPNLEPAELSGTVTGTPGTINGIFMIVLLAPWAFAGFEAVALETTHFDFPIRRSRRVIILAIVCGGFSYTVLSLLGVSATPEGFSSWQEYIGALSHLSGVDSVPTFHAVQSHIGTPGLVLISISALAAVMTGILGASRACVRMLSTMAEDRILSRKFLGSTFSILFILIISIILSFFGRNALIWFVELTSFGAVIAYGYTSAAAAKIAGAKGDRSVRFTGRLGTCIAVVFAAVLLFSRLGSIETMSAPSFLLLAVWCLAGFAFYWRTMRQSDLTDYDGSAASSTVLFGLLMYSVMMWFAKSLYQSADSAATKQMVVRNGIVLVLFTGIGLIVMLYVQKMLSARHNRIEREKLRAEESSKAKTQFLFNMSHDIRTPMNAILGFTHLAEQEPDVPPAVRDYIQKIDVSGRHLQTLINDMLEMSRIENDGLVLEEENHDLIGTVETAFEMFRTSMEEKRIHYILDKEEVQTRFVVFDRDRMLRVLLNLLSNACKFTPAEGEVRVTLRETGEAGPEEAAYEISVKDTGIGMTEEFVENVYEAFERERSSTISRKEGTGLGMAITKKIVDAMNGSIEINTAPNEGTEFRICLRFRKAAEAASDALQNTEAAVLRPEFAGKRVLLVEDMEINRQIAEMLLEGMGFVVDYVENGRIAVEKIRDSDPGRYDAVLMDIQMPEMDGYEATAAIRALPDPVLSTIPVIAVTANAFAEDIEKAKEAGMDGHIAKPIDPEQMAKTLSALFSDVKQ